MISVHADDEAGALFDVTGTIAEAADGQPYLLLRTGAADYRR